MKFSNAIHSKVLCILCLFLSLYHVHCATFSFDLRSFIYRCKLLLMILHAWTAGWWRFWVKNWWKLCLRKKQAPASLTAKQNSVKTVSFLPHVWRENGQSSKYGRRRQIWTKPGKKYYTFIMKWWRTTSRIAKRIACVVISLPPPVLIFDFFHNLYEKNQRWSIWSMLLIETFFIQSTFWPDL